VYGQGRAADPVLFLALMDATWQDHCKQMLTIRSIFLYLDRTYVMQTAGVKSLWDLGLGLFRSHLERGHEVVRKAVTGLLRLLEKERQGESIDRMATKSLLRMFSSLQVTTRVPHSLSLLWVLRGAVGLQLSRPLGRRLGARSVHSLDAALRRCTRTTSRSLF
jgi:hypothetical protein